jgi:hypothetical protein
MVQKKSIVLRFIFRKINTSNHTTVTKIDITSKTSIESWNILRRISMMTYDSVTTIQENNFK